MPTIARIESLVAATSGTQTNSALPALPTTIANTQIGLLEEILKIAEVDIPAMIAEFEKRDFLDLGETAFIDILRVVGTFGVPGVNIAATIAPYLFDWLNSFIAKKVALAGSTFVTALSVAHSSVAAIVTAINAGNYAQAAMVSADEMLAEAGTIFVGPEIDIARLVVEAGFYIVQSGQPINISRLIGDVDEIGDLIGGKEIRNPAYPDYKWNTVKGWVFSPLPVTK